MGKIYVHAGDVEDTQREGSAVRTPIASLVLRVSCTLLSLSLSLAEIRDYAQSTDLVSDKCKN